LNFFTKIFFTSLLLLLFSTPLFSTVYENAENKKTDKWYLLKDFSTGSVKNIYDKKKKSRVIKFEGESTRTAYRLKPKKGFDKSNKRGEKLLSWEMNYSEDFVIIIEVKTKKGKRYLIYTPGDNNFYLEYGLGRDASSGGWKKYSRNLEKDLQESEFENKIVSIENFVIRGSGRIDNIRLKKEKQKDKKKETKKESVQNLVPKTKISNKKYTPKLKKVEKNSMPTIFLNGKNPMVLKKGEPYIEPGAMAQDKDGSEVMVTISEDIDIFKEGEYTVIYMATNSIGNSVINQRRVRVGEVIEEEPSSSSVKSSEREEAPEEESEQEILDLENRALEMSEWEKELALREKALAQKEQHSELPLRPGLEL